MAALWRYQIHSTAEGKIIKESDYAYDSEQSARAAGTEHIKQTGGVPREGGIWSVNAQPKNPDQVY
ncbi:MAG: hypothetical protein WCA16_09785 [Candidatus Sulfotelmatobacter sp.]